MKKITSIKQAEKFVKTLSETDKVTLCGLSLINDKIETVIKKADSIFWELILVVVLLVIIKLN